MHAGLARAAVADRRQRGLGVRSHKAGGEAAAAEMLVTSRSRTPQIT